VIRRLGGLTARLLVALAVFLVAGEVLARALDVVDRLNGYQRILYTRGPSLDLPHRLRPGVETTLLGAPVRVNRLGFRGPEITPAPAPGVHRVLVLGDSVVFGQGLEEEETVSGVLAVRLNAGGAGRYEVINAGVPGYDAVAEARLLETVGVAVRPEIVIVGTSLNDYDVAPMYSPTGVLMNKALDQRAGTLADRSEFLALLRWLYASWRGQLWNQLMARLGPPGPPPPPQTGLQRLVQEMHLGFYHAPVPAYWDRLRGAYADLGRIAERHRLSLLVAIFPERYQVGLAEPDLTPQQRLLGACREAGLRCLDLQPAFAAAGGELFADAQHPNARGHMVAAEAIAEALLSSGPPRAEHAVGPASGGEQTAAQLLEPGEDRHADARAAERRPAEAVVKDQPAERQGLRHRELDGRER